MDEKLKKSLIFILVGVSLIGVVAVIVMLKETDDIPENCKVEVIFNDYIAEDDNITFNCNIIFENHSFDDKFYKLSGDFRTEYYAGMIEERTLVCYDSQTNFNIFFIPAQTQGVFEVAFTSKGDSSVKKPDKLAPKVMVEEVSKNIANSNKFVKNAVYIGLNGNSDIFFNSTEDGKNQSGDGSMIEP